MTDKQRNMGWLSDKLKEQVREVFEPKYDHVLSDDEVYEIASNLADFTEVLAKARSIDDKLESKGTA